MSAGMFVSATALKRYKLSPEPLTIGLVNVCLFLPTALPARKTLLAGRVGGVVLEPK